MTTWTSHSLAETFEIAKDFALRLQPGDKIALCGELGSGKTHFAKGVIAALSDQTVDEIPSPTFTLIEEYLAKTPLYHLDLYRLHKNEELEELDQDILYGREGITLIEWAERFQNILDHCNYKVSFYKLSINERKLEIIQLQ